MQRQERGRQIWGWGCTEQIEAETKPDEFYVGATERAWEAVWWDTLPGRIHERGTEPEAWTVGGPRTGTTCFLAYTSLWLGQYAWSDISPRKENKSENVTVNPHIAHICNFSLYARLNRKRKTNSLSVTIIIILSLLNLFMTFCHFKKYVLFWSLGLEGGVTV